VQHKNARERVLLADACGMFASNWINQLKAGTAKERGAPIEMAMVMAITDADPEYL